jgi:hypothetical protein
MPGHHVRPDRDDAVLDLDDRVPAAGLELEELEADSLVLALGQEADLSLLDGVRGNAATESSSAAVTTPWPPRPWMRTSNMGQA